MKNSLRKRINKIRQKYNAKFLHVNYYKGNIQGVAIGLSIVDNDEFEFYKLKFDGDFIHLLYNVTTEHPFYYVIYSMEEYIMYSECDNTYIQPVLDDLQKLNPKTFRIWDMSIADVK